MNILTLHGLDGSNPLGFLAALGALRVATTADPNARLGWMAEDVPPHPFLDCALDVTGFAETVCSEVGRIADGVAAFGDIVKVPSDTFRQAAFTYLPERALPGDITDSDYFAAFASDAVDDKDGKVEPTMLSFSNGGAGQHLLKDFRSLARECKPQQVTDAVVHGKHSFVPLTNLNWDPAALRNYALRWRNPEKDAKATSVPLHLLGFLGMAAFTSAPDGHRIVTTGFDRRGRVWTWRLWRCALPYSVALSVLRTPPNDAINTRSLFKSRRLTSNKRFYFAPAVPSAAPPTAPHSGESGEPKP